MIRLELQWTFSENSGGVGGGEQAKLEARHPAGRLIIQIRDIDGWCWR